jgi:hypothetical protein
MNKNLPQFLKYIFPSGKYWTGVWFLRERDHHLPVTSVGRVDIDLTLDVKLFSTQPMTRTYESATSDEYMGIRKHTRLKILSLLVISKAKKSLRCFQKLTKGFCPDSMDACIVVSSAEGTIGLRVFGEVR